MKSTLPTPAAALALILSFCLILPSCIIAGGNTPVFVQPSPQALIGLWKIDHISGTPPDRGQLQHTTLQLSPGGSYEFSASPAALANPLLPAKTGHWKLVKDYGDFDPGSRPSWAIRFTPRQPGKAPGTAWLVDGSPAPQLFFMLHMGAPLDPTLRMKKAE